MTRQLMSDVYATKPRPAVIVQDDLFDATKSVTVCSDVQHAVGCARSCPSGYPAETAEYPEFITTEGHSERP